MNSTEEAINSPVTMKKSGAPPVKATSFLDLVRDGLPKPLSAPAGTRQDVITSLDPLMQAQAELTLKRIGEAGTQTHLILANPVTGDLRAFIAPGPGRWSGKGGNPESFLPLLIIPALIPDKQDRARYTLTSQVFAPTQTGGALTFRAAFHNERTLLTQRLIAAERDKVVSVLKEFGISARTNRRTKCSRGSRFSHGDGANIFFDGDPGKCIASRTGYQDFGRIHGGFAGR